MQITTTTLAAIDEVDQITLAERAMDKRVAGSNRAQVVTDIEKGHD